MLGEPHDIAHNNIILGQLIHYAGSLMYIDLYIIKHII